MTIPYGFKTIGEGFNNVIIDDANGMMHVTEIGNYTTNSNGTATINFVTPCPSEPPPMLFLRPSNQGGCYNLSFVGSPGNWTGARFETLYGVAATHGYFLGVLNPNPSGEQWGMRVRGGDGKLIYDSGLGYTQLVARLSGNQWTYQGKTRVGSTYYWTYVINNPNVNYYFLANPWCAGTRQVRSRDAGATVAPSGFSYTVGFVDNSRAQYKIQFSQLNDNYDPNFTEDFLLAVPRT